MNTAVLSNSRVPLPAAVLMAIAGGFAMDGAFPAFGWWPLAFVAVILGLLSLEGRSLPEAALIGTVFGAAFYFPHLSWAASFLGDRPLSWVPWVALASAEALIMGALSPLITLAYRWFPEHRRNSWGGALALAALVSGAWMAREISLGSWPYGGLPWGRLGMSQSESPIAQVASWVGVSGLGFFMVMLCAMLLQVVRTICCNSASTRVQGRLVDGSAWQGWTRVLPAGMLVGVLVMTPQYPTQAAGTFRVGAVQGNGPAAYADIRLPGEVLAAQLNASAPLRDEDVDLVLWPEGGVDRDPMSDPGTALRLTAAARSYDAPILINAAIDEGGRVYNRSVLWTADGPGDAHAKHYPVPFGEYVPDRWLYEMIAPGLIGMLEREYVPGTEAPRLDIDGVEAGLAICFDVVFDDVLTESVLGGSQVHLFQTNNADFRGTDEHLQQLAFARMRSIETGRSVVNLSTTGSSQAFDPAGNTIAGLPSDEAGVMVVDVELRTGVTAGIALGPGIRLLLGWGTLVTLVALGWIEWSMARRTRGLSRLRSNIQ